LEESGDKEAGGGDLVELKPVEAAHEDMVAEDVVEGAVGEVVREEVGGGEVGVGDNEEREGGAVMRERRRKKAKEKMRERIGKEEKGEASRFSTGTIMTH